MIYTVSYQYLEFNWDTNSWDTTWQSLGPGNGSPSYPLEVSSMPWGRYWIVAKATLSGLCPGTVYGSGRYLNVAEIQFTEFFGVSQGGGTTDPASTNFYPGGNPDSVNDGYPNTPHHESTFNMGAGDRYEWGRNTPVGTLHDRVGIRVRVVPNVNGIPVHFRLVDADDPTDSNGPIDNDIQNPSANCNPACDNRWMGAPLEVNHPTVATSGTHAHIEKAFVISQGNPGDNYRWIVAHRGGSANHLDRIKPVVPDTYGRSFYDLNNNGTRQSPSEPMLTDAVSVLITGNHFYSLPLLTIWRTLHVEVDSMGAPPPNYTPPPGVNPFGTFDDPHPNGDIPDPSTAYFANAFRKSFLSMDNNPSYVSGGQLVNANQSTLPFEKGFSSQPSMVSFFASHQQIPHTEEYWSSYLAGVYEYWASADRPGQRRQFRGGMDGLHHGRSLLCWQRDYS